MEPRVLLPALLAAIALLLAVRAPGRELGRLRVGRARPEVQRGPVGRLIGGRPDAPSLRHRVEAAAVAGGALCLGVRAHPAASPWVWCGWPLLGVAVLLAGEAGAAVVPATPTAAGARGAAGARADGRRLAAGLPPRRACAAVVEAFDGPVADDLGQVLRSVDLGLPDAQAWRTLATTPALGAAARDLPTVESGTGLVEALRNDAAAARERRRAALQEAARAVGVRSVLPLTTCFLPAFLLLGIVPTVASAVLQAFR